MARWIKYVGLAHQRIITAADWRTVGISADTVVWSAHNGFTVPADGLSDDQITKAITPDSDFVVVGEDDDFRPTTFSNDMTPSTFTQTVENPVDPVGIVNGARDVSTASSGVVPGAGGTSPTSTGTGSGAGSDTPGETAH